MYSNTDNWSSCMKWYVLRLTFSLRCLKKHSQQALSIRYLFLKITVQYEGNQITARMQRQYIVFHYQNEIGDRMCILPFISFFRSHDQINIWFSWDIPRDDFALIKIYDNAKIVCFDISKIACLDEIRSFLVEILLEMIIALVILITFVKIKRLWSRHPW